MHILLLPASATAPWHRDPGRGPCKPPDSPMPACPASGLSPPDSPTPPHARILNSESRLDCCPFRFLSLPLWWGLGWDAAGGVEGGALPQTASLHTRVCIPPSLMPPLGAQAFRNLRRATSRCKPEGGGPRRVGGVVVLASAFTAKRNLRASHPLSAALGFQAREKRGLAFAHSTWGDEGQKRKEVVRVCKGTGTLPHLLVQSFPHQGPFIVP